MAVTVNIYDGCGCEGATNGSGGVSSGGSGGVVGSGRDSDGFIYSGTPDNQIAVNACDIATTIAPAILALCAELIQTVEQAVNGGEQVVDAIAELAGTNAIVSVGTVGASNLLSEIVDTLTSILSNQPDNLIGALTSTELIREFQFASYQYLSRNKQQVLPLTRGDLRGMVNALKATTKAVWGAPTDDDFVVGLGVYLLGLVSTINLSRINRDAMFAAGTGNSAICRYAAELIGESYTDRYGLPSGDAGEFSSTTIGDYTFYYSDVSLTYSYITNADINLPAFLGDISAIAVTNFQTAGAGGNEHRLLLDGTSILASNPQGLFSGIWAIGEPIATQAIATNKAALFTETVETVTQSVFADNADTVSGTALRFDLTPNSSPEITRTITRIVIAVLS